MAHARHGLATPLMREIGPNPSQLVRRVPLDHGVCSLRLECLGFRPEACLPGRKLPDCYQPPKLEGEASEAAIKLALCWREGRYVVVVLGDEFNLL